MDSTCVEEPALVETAPDMGMVPINASNQERNNASKPVKEVEPAAWGSQSSPTTINTDSRWR